jgi:D-arginine dehydrogenase
VTDFLVVGGGIAGAAAGCFLSEHGTVTLLETEQVAGVHSTKRSAALLSEYYGGPAVRAMTSASRELYGAHPELLRPRGVLAIAPLGAEAEFEAALKSGSTAPQGVQELTGTEAQQLCPILRPAYYERAMLKPGAYDVDVTAAHQGFLAAITASSGKVVTSAPVTSLNQRAGRWHADTPAGRFSAPVVVNAAGAWADEVAALADVPGIGLVSRRRTMALASSPAGHPAADVARWPMLTDVTETFYAKPDSGGLLLSPVDSEPMPPGSPEAAAEDVARAITRFEQATTAQVQHVTRSWAGLRSSVVDDVPVIGEAPSAAGFFWLAALGGYGIQIAPAAGELLAGLVTGARLPARLSTVAAATSPARTGVGIRAMSA